MVTKKLKILVILLLTLGLQNNLNAETWNEPWQKEILQTSEYFILGHIFKVDSLGVHIEVSKNFGVKQMPKTILLNGFSMLNLTSASGQGVHFKFKVGDNFYFLLKKGDDGNYKIPTPTSGYAKLNEENKVYATYRHSYHLALIPKDIYELTYQAIWNYYRRIDYDKNSLLKFINEQIDKEPAGFEEDEIATFFLQHASVETAYLMNIPIDLNRIKKFANCDNFHSRVSAVQFMSTLDSKEAKDFLFDYIQNDTKENFEIVIAIRSLKKIGGKEYTDKLIAIEDKLSDEETGFGGNIMDPRVGTYFPSPRRAVREKLKSR